jgi:hypothetical protein
MSRIYFARFIKEFLSQQHVVVNGYGIADELGSLGGGKAMKSRFLRGLAVVLMFLSLASFEAVGQETSARRSRSDAVKREPLRPFSEIEALLLRGALIAAAIPAIWFVIVLIGGALRDRREAKNRQDPPPRSEVGPSAGSEP